MKKKLNNAKNTMPSMLYNPESADSRNTLSILSGIPSALMAKWSGSQVPGIKAEYDEDGEYLDRHSVLVKSKSGKYFLNIEGPILPSSIAQFLRCFMGISCVSGQDVRMALDSFNGSELTVRINSPGGIATEASAIYDSIVRLGKSGVAIRTNITGLAASAATLVMLATKEIEMSPLAIMFIHNSHNTVNGNQFEMRAEANLLAQYDVSMAAMYAERMGTDEKTALDVMSKQTDSLLGRGTWMSAEDALEAKLITSVLSKEDDEMDDDDMEDDDQTKASLTENGRPEVGDNFSGDLVKFKALSLLFNSAKV